MKTLYYFLFLAFCIRTNSQMIENPIFLIESQNLIILSTNDDNYYCITSDKNFKLKKESGEKGTIKNNQLNILYYNYFSDNRYNNYLYKLEKDTYVTITKLNFK